MVSANRNIDYLRSLLSELRKQPKETEWLEFKHNNCEPNLIGEYISALANAAAYHEKTTAYLVWGIDDASHEIVGTTFSIARQKVGNEELENWVLRLLQPKLNFHFHEFEAEGHTVTLLEIQAAVRQPVQFKQQEFIRVGSYTKKLKEHPERERALWRIFEITPFEKQIAQSHLTSDEVLRLIHYPAYFDLTGTPLPDGAERILESLARDCLIDRDETGRWNISNLGAILFARSLNDFPSLKRKSVRVVLYDGDGRIRSSREQQFEKGYAVAFEALIEFVNSLLPSNEVIGQALRKSVPMFPELAVRELIANALIHQDFNETGNGPMIEIFTHRMEITNPGLPLVETQRFLDSPPKSRNEMLASLLRRIGVCEERGSGIDKVVFETEYYQLPAPSFETIINSTKAVLFAHKELNEMDKSDKIRACYLHACLRFVERKEMTNQSLRERFNIEEHNRALVTRIINETISAKLIHPSDPNQGRKHAKYIPFWASDLSQ
ncbi:MAG TPA: transcriptional regulator [Opitutae bacterium]|nr:transcriptional regulator [Puniceicoccaceae bacterium]HBR94471.1 transcriptional regulator [Opitutae bacterium]|tara:strand:+ start:9417 stop:10901 length:1485 start_codon:yes stop_codon:yes gene_type:complete